MLFEFYYQRRSKIFYLFLSVILLLSALMFVSQIMLIQSHLRHFQYYVEEALRGETIQEILEQPFSISMNQNTEIVDNPLKYHYVAYHSSFAALNVQNGVNQLLSSSFLFSFLFFGGIRDSNSKCRYQIPYNENQALFGFSMANQSS